MTDYEFDVYWYRVLSVVVSTLLKNGLDDMNQKAIEPLLRQEILDVDGTSSSSPMVAYNKITQLLETISYVANNKLTGANLGKIHAEIKNQLKRLYILYAHRSSIARLINARL
ncbi:hypothetical protein IB642_07800 [Allofrancisella guangzhouensis]|uniref:Uncharacterized protein n=1 Tax=Allofrancisella guangzhouensis TaxID=594679 RepID=A0A0A8E5F5_9GAMM|nr:hypothetical protein [Allofrancisella guangzhouensis]AJC49233.1 hypothetical protein SD28_06100 [Allofrancisella guangzhouensis]MBK2044915.1 hypothetical protein [Allofrancisella guangzhouensis]MBK2046440.1 hypothetical protein [Allofrancisella guangzhouensis]